MKVHNIDGESLLQENNDNRSITICEAVDCYEAATEAIVVSIGKLGTIDLHLCHECVVTKSLSEK